MRPISGSSPAVPSKKDVELALAVRDVMHHAVKVHREITEAKPFRTSRVRTVLLAIVMVPLLALCAYSWFARPVLIWGVATRISPVRLEANARVTMVLLAQRLDGHRDADGNYPKSLALIGEQSTGVGYRLLSDSVFELRSNGGGRELVLRSNDRRDAFLGNSLEVIAGHVR
jgi:hypothetical protein